MVTCLCVHQRSAKSPLEQVGWWRGHSRGRLGQESCPAGSMSRASLVQVVMATMALISYAVLCPLGPTCLDCQQLPRVSGRFFSQPHLPITGITRDTPHAKSFFYIELQLGIILESVAVSLWTSVQEIQLGHECPYFGIRLTVVPAFPICC